MTVEIAVIVPVIERPQAAEPFMDSWRATTKGHSHVYPTAHDFPTYAAWDEAMSRNGYFGPLIGGATGTTYAAKVNYAYRITKEPWLLLVGDDVRFHEGWEEAALAAMGHGGVISTNDGHRDDLHLLAVHPIFQRTYLDTLGATVDGPGTLAHEGYHHAYVDQEWSYVARKRGMLHYAPDCLIEHLHPLWGKGEVDHIYELGNAHNEEDRELCVSRLEAWGARGCG